MELCLGTVQFGLDYGIRGQKKPSPEYCISCLDYATQNGILALDTAPAYGTAEEITGCFLRKKTIPRHKLFISTKLPPNILDDIPARAYECTIRKYLQKSLSVLGTDYIDAYLLHTSGYAFNPEILAALGTMRKEGLAIKTGVSVYEPEEAMTAIGHPAVNFIQAPYSIFDHRMKESRILDQAENAECQLHARSAFLQGLITMEEQKIPAYLDQAKPLIRKISRICTETGLSRVELAMAYVKRERAVSHLVFGVDSLEQLKEDITLFQKNVSQDLLCIMEYEFRHSDSAIIMPSLWKK